MKSTISILVAVQSIVGLDSMSLANAVVLSGFFGASRAALEIRKRMDMAIEMEMGTASHLAVLFVRYHPGAVTTWNLGVGR